MLKGCLKAAVTLTGTLLILGAVGVVLLGTRAETYAKDALERGLSYATRTRLTLEALRFHPLEQSVELHGLTLYNPREFGGEPAVSVRRATVQFDPKSLFTAEPRLERVLLEGLDVNLRYELGEGTNLGALARAAGGEAVPQDDAAPAPDATPRHRQFVVGDFRCEDITVSLSTDLVPLASVRVNVAPFTLTEAGERPMTAGQATDLLLRTLIRETLTLKGLLTPARSELEDEAAGTP